MEVTVEKASALQRKLTVRVPGDELEKKIDSRLKELGKQVKIKGFRPGRVPPKVLKQRYGQSVRQEVVSELVQSSLFEAIEKESLRLASNPVLDKVEDVADSTDIEFTASVEVYPEIGPLDVSEFPITRPVASVEDGDVAEMLETLREQRQTWEDVDEPATEGHQVIVEYVADLDGNRVPEQGKQRLALMIGSSGFEALESAVSGRKAGDSQSLSLAFPEGYGDRQLAGREAAVELEILNVQQARRPEIDEAFIRSFSIDSGDIEDLRSEVRSNLERELDQATKTYLKRQAVALLLEHQGDLEVPESIVRNEAESLRRRAAEQQEIEPDSLDVSQYMEPARSRVRSGLLLAEVARQNNIVVDGARVRQAVESVAETYENPMEVVQAYYGNQQLLQGVENLVLEEQVVDWIVEQAKVDDKAMSMKEVISAAANAGPSK